MFARRGTAVIDRAVSLVADRLNQHARRRFDISDDIVSATTLSDPEGKPVQGARNRLVLFVTNIAQETAARRARPRAGGAGLRIAVSPEPVHLNVFFMIAANFDAENYGEALKVLSVAAQFLQSNPVLDHVAAPEMDARLAQLTFEIDNLDAQTVGQLWGVHGGRYLPSIHYKMRLVTIDGGWLTREDLAITRPETRPEPAVTP